MQRLPVLRGLVVDDEPAVRDGLATWLGQRQFSVLTAPDLQSAMDAARNHQLDVILLDVKLGVEDGLQLVKRLQDAGLAIPCVAFTGHAGPSDGFQARDLGVVELLEKPSSPDEVALALRRAAAKPPIQVDPTVEGPRADLSMVVPVRYRIAVAVFRLVTSESDQPHWRAVDGQP